MKEACLAIAILQNDSEWNQKHGDPSKPYSEFLLLMEEILHQLIGSLSHFLRVFYIPGGWPDFFNGTKGQPNNSPCFVEF